MSRHPREAGPARRYLRDAERFLLAGDAVRADNAVLCALALSPADVDVLRIAARVDVALGRHGQAIAQLTRVLAADPADVRALRDLLQAQTAVGELAAAVGTASRIVRTRPDVAAWIELGLALDRNGDCAEGLAAAASALALAPGHAAARFLAARCLTGLGRIDEAVAHYRDLTAIRSEAAKAWFALADLKTVTFSSADLAAMATLADHRDTGTDDRLLLDFALGTAYEKAGRPADAWASIERANRARRRQVRWDAAAYSRTIDAIRDAFDAPVAAAPPDLGSEVIFVVGMPRSGTTVVEQLLGAHPDVVAAGELPYLEQVLGEESARRGQAFPRWVRSATAADWERLGQRYLALASRWRTAGRFVDKMPENWPYVGAALAMLPGARVIGCERDLVETCWSCCKQLFAPQRVAWSYALDDLAAYARDSRRLWAGWQSRDPSRCRTLVYEALTADPRSEMTALLDFCGLSLHADCFETGHAPISRTASAAQVRGPLRRDTGRAALYGEVFAPLRDALAAAERINPPRP